MKKRVFLIVLDSFGIGEMEDAASFGDLGTNTIGSVSTSSYFDIPNLKKLGLLNIEGVRVQNQVLEEHPTAAVRQALQKAQEGMEA